MIRTIEAFRKDDQGDWIAALSCLHSQHVRHRPPFIERAWVLTAEGRAGRVGTDVDCPLCDRAELPDGLERIRTAGPFDAESVPAGLLRDHRVGARTWGLVRVLEGSLRFTLAVHPALDRRLAAGDSQAIPPGIAHAVELIGPTRFEVDFLARPVAAHLNDDVTATGVFQTVLDGYDAVYDALPASTTFSRIWRDNAYGADFPEEFAHIGFLTLGEARRLVGLIGIGIGAGDPLVDIACGTGGPGLWVAQETGAALTGVDPSAVGLAVARERARRVGLDGRSHFVEGTFEQTGLPDGAAAAVMTIEALQYAPDKRAAFAEFGRVLRPGGVLAIVCFEVDPAKVVGMPVLGVDPVPDYTPLLEAAGFAVEVYEETPGWEERVYGTFGKLVDAADAVVADMGERAAASAMAEAMLTVSMKPYPRRVMIAARRAGVPA